MKNISVIFSPKAEEVYKDVIDHKEYNKKFGYKKE